MHIYIIRMHAHSLAHCIHKQSRHARCVHAIIHTDTSMKDVWVNLVQNALAHIFKNYQDVLHNFTNLCPGYEYTEF